MIKAVTTMFYELLRLIFGFSFILAPLVFIFDMFTTYNIMSFWEMLGVIIISMFMYYLVDETLKKDK